MCYINNTLQAFLILELKDIEKCKFYRIDLGKCLILQGYIDDKKSHFIKGSLTEWIDANGLTDNEISEQEFEESSEDHFQYMIITEKVFVPRRDAMKYRLSSLNIEDVFTTLD